MLAIILFVAGSTIEMLPVRFIETPFHSLRAVGLGGFGLLIVPHSIVSEKLRYFNFRTNLESEGKFAELTLIEVITG